MGRQQGPSAPPIEYPSSFIKNFPRDCTPQYVDPLLGYPIDIYNDILTTPYGFFANRALFGVTHPCMANEFIGYLSSDRKNITIEHWIITAQLDNPFRYLLKKRIFIGKKL